MMITQNNREESPMTHLDMVEKLRSAAGLSYAEAKAALERNGWDILDAMVELEKNGGSAPGADYTTPEKKSHYFQPTSAQKPQDSAFRRACRWIWSLVKKSCHNCITAVRRGEDVLSLPIIVFIALLFICFWVVVPAMVIALFFDVRYTISGPDVSGTKAADVVENVSEKAASAVGTVAEKVSDAFDRKDE